MLGKTAGGLYWMARYLERAENTSRLLETGQRMALTRSGNDHEDWGPVLQTAGMYSGYLEKFDTMSKENAIEWMLRDPDNPSSVRSVIKQARDNARLVRTALTYDVWAAINTAWMRIEDVLRRKVSERDLPQVLELIRRHSGQVRGATHGTMLRNDIYDFVRIGLFSERADCTGRILDVKYYVLLPTALSVGSSLDNVQWESILRSVGAGGSYRMTHGLRTRPGEIAEFLILDERMPRSLLFCCSKLVTNLGYLEKDYATKSTSGEMARTLHARIANQNIADIIENGLHECIQSFLRDLAQLNTQIEIDYRFYG